ncbi:hypothetical protein RI367_004261 [Sorochytrium milnesiophthora]
MSMGSNGMHSPPSVTVRAPSSISPAADDATKDPHRVPVAAALHHRLLQDMSTSAAAKPQLTHSLPSVATDAPTGTSTATTTAAPSTTKPTVQLAIPMAPLGARRRSRSASGEFMTSPFDTAATAVTQHLRVSIHDSSSGGESEPPSPASSRPGSPDRLLPAAGPSASPSSHRQRPLSTSSVVTESNTSHKSLISGGAAAAAGRGVRSSEAGDQESGEEEGDALLVTTDTRGAQRSVSLCNDPDTATEPTIGRAGDDALLELSKSPSAMTSDIREPVITTAPSQDTQDPSTMAAVIDPAIIKKSNASFGRLFEAKASHGSLSSTGRPPKEREPPRPGRIDKLIAWIRMQDSLRFGYGFGQFSRWAIWSLSAAGVFATLNVVLTVIAMATNYKACIAKNNSTLFQDTSCMVYDVLFILFIGGIFKELLKLIVLAVVLYFAEERDKELQWAYAFISHSSYMLPLLRYSHLHRNKYAKQNALTIVVHPKVVFLDLMFSDIPLSVQTFAENISAAGRSQWTVLVLLFTGASLLFHVSHFTLHLLLIINEYGKAKQRSVRRKDAVQRWTNKLQTHLLLFGSDADKEMFQQKLKVLVENLNRKTGYVPRSGMLEKYGHIFQSVMEVAAITTLTDLLNAVHPLNFHRDPYLFSLYDDFKMLRLSYAAELRHLEGSTVWKALPNAKMLRTMEAIWRNRFVEEVYRKLTTTHSEIWVSHRFSQVQSFVDLHKDCERIRALISTNLKFGGQCLDNIYRLFPAANTNYNLVGQDDKEAANTQIKLTIKDIETASQTLTEALFVEGCNTSTFSFDVERYETLCLLNMPSQQMAQARFKQLYPLSDFFVLLLDMNTFDEVITQTLPGGQVAKTTSLRNRVETIEEMLDAKTKASKVLIAWLNYEKYRKKLNPKHLAYRQDDLLECYPSLKKIATSQLSAKTMQRYFEQKFRKLDQSAKVNKVNITDEDGLDSCIEMLVMEMRARKLNESLAEANLL